MLTEVNQRLRRQLAQALGQIARYIGWIQAYMATAGQPVEGLIVAHESDESLRYAVSAVPGVRLMVYEIASELRDTAKS